MSGDPLCPGCERPRSACLCAPAAPVVAPPPPRPARTPREVARDLLVGALNDANLSTARMLPAAMANAAILLEVRNAPHLSAAYLVLKYAEALLTELRKSSGGPPVDTVARLVAQLAVEALRYECQCSKGESPAAGYERHLGDLGRMSLTLGSLHEMHLYLVHEHGFVQRSQIVHRQAEQRGDWYLQGRIDELEAQLASVKAEQTAAAGGGQ